MVCYGIFWSGQLCSRTLCKTGSENVDRHAVSLAKKSGAAAFNHSEIELNPILTCLNGFSCA